MNKSGLYSFFDGQISRSAIQHRYDEWVVIGKFCVITVEDNLIDIWLCHPKDSPKALGARTIKNRLDALKSPSTMLVRELTGEGIVRTSCKQDVLSNLNLLGIRKARYVSEVHRLNFLARMNINRESEERGNV